MSLVLLRKDKGLTTVQVAERLNISQGHYSHLENGERSINDEIAQGLADLLGVDKEVILQKSRDIIEQRGTLQHWLNKIKFRGEPLVDVIVNELRFDKSVNTEETEKLIYRIADIAGHYTREDIIWDFKEKPELINYFIKRLKE